MSAHRRTPRILTLLLAAVMAVSATTPAASDDPLPTLRLLGSTDEAHGYRFPRDRTELQLGTYLAAVGGAFDLRVTRTGDGYRAHQVVESGDDLQTVRVLPAWATRDLTEGLRGFFDITVRNADGDVVRTRQAPLCFGGFDVARVDDSGPETPTYPDSCFASPLTRATVWGLDQGWAVSAPSFASVRVPDGSYDVTVAINQRYADLFEVSPRHRSVQVRWTVTTEHYPGPCEPEPPVEGRDPAGPPTQELEEEPCEFALHAQSAQSAAIPYLDASAPEVSADATGLPDLVAMPAHSTMAYEEGRRDTLAFGATVWNAGQGPLVVEGFREPGSDFMTAYQYLYENGQRVGRLEAGTLEYDTRDGHDHWHFTDFARYRLLDADQNRVVRSGKEAFCLAPTDAIDLTLPNANWHPGQTGLHSNCGGEQSIWIREILDVGWGDTYVQSLPGQSFNITNVPNGIYYIEVVTNPDLNLREATHDNNRALTKVRLRGTRSNRTVKEL